MLLPGMCVWGRGGFSNEITCFFLCIVRKKKKNLQKPTKTKKNQKTTKTQKKAKINKTQKKQNNKNKKKPKKKPEKKTKNKRTSPCTTKDFHCANE